MGPRITCFACDCNYAFFSKIISIWTKGEYCGNSLKFEGLIEQLKSLEKDGKTKVLKPRSNRTVRSEKLQTAHFYGSFSLKNRSMGKK